MAHRPALNAHGDNVISSAEKARVILTLAAFGWLAVIGLVTVIGWLL